MLSQPKTSTLPSALHDLAKSQLVANMPVLLSNLLKNLNKNNHECKNDTAYSVKAKLQEITDAKLHEITDSTLQQNELEKEKKAAAAKEEEEEDVTMTDAA